MKSIGAFAFLFAVLSAAAELETSEIPEGVPELAAKSVADWEAVERPQLMRTILEEEYGVRPVERPADLKFAETAVP